MYWDKLFFCIPIFQNFSLFMYVCLANNLENVTKSNFKTFSCSGWAILSLWTNSSPKLDYLWKLDLKVSLILGKIKYLTMTDASKVWMPDTFFRNEKIGRFHTILTPNLYVRVFPNGDVLYSIRWVVNSKSLLKLT